MSDPDRPFEAAAPAAPDAVAGPAHAEASAPAWAEAPPPARAPRVAPRTLATILAACALLVAVVAWIDARRVQRDFRAEVAQRLSGIDASTAATAKTEVSLAGELHDAQAQINQLEAHLAESQSQQAALEALYRDLAPSRDEIAVSEIEQVLLVANQQLQLAGNVPSALTALQLADLKLRQLDRPQFLPLRRALANDMDALRAVPFVDVTGLSLKLDQAMLLAPSLPLAMDERVPQAAAVEGRSAATRGAGVAARARRCVGAAARPHPHREHRPARRRAACAVATVFRAREPEAAPAGRAHRAAESRRRQFSRRCRCGGGTAEAVLRHSREAGAAAPNVALWNAIERIVALAPHAVVLGGGGYNPWTLTRYWTGLWGRLSGRAIPDALPAEGREILERLHCDLIDDEDMRPQWLTTLADPPTTAAVRTEVRALRDEVLGNVDADRWRAYAPALAVTAVPGTTAVGAAPVEAATVLEEVSR